MDEARPNHVRRGRPHPGRSAVTIDGMRPGQRFLFGAGEWDFGQPRALTLAQPWPYAVCHLGKRLENRTWRPPRDQIGRRLLIHGGAIPRGWDRATRKRDEEAVADLVVRFGGQEHHDFVERHVATKGEFSWSDCFLAGIVAVATVAGVVDESRDPWFVGPFGWVLQDLIVLPEPIPCRGALGLWRPPVGVLAEVRSWLGDAPEPAGVAR